MNPKVRLRSSSRSRAGRLSMRRPSRWMQPSSGLSSVPSRCSMVLLPEPELPMTLRNSPLANVEVEAAQHLDLDRASRR